jgi:uncharacterized protein (DUF433 family)
MGSRQVVSESGKLGGEPFLEGTRVRVSDVAVKYERLGYSVEEVLEAYPELDRADVHSALAYYYNNEEAVSVDLDSSTGAKPA